MYQLQLRTKFLAFLETFQLLRSPPKQTCFCYSNICHLQISSPKKQFEGAELSNQPKAPINALGNIHKEIQLDPGGLSICELCNFYTIVDFGLTLFKGLICIYLRCMCYKRRQTRFSIRLHIKNLNVQRRSKRQIVISEVFCFLFSCTCAFNLPPPFRFYSICCCCSHINNFILLS